MTNTLFLLMSVAWGCTIGWAVCDDRESTSARYRTPLWQDMLATVGLVGIGVLALYGGFTLGGAAL